VRASRIGVVALAAALVVSACSDSGSGDSTGTTPTTAGQGVVSPPADGVVPDVPDDLEEDPGCPAPTGSPDTGVTVTLERLFEGGEVASFGVPLPRGAVTDAALISVRAGGQPVEASVEPILDEYGPDGNPVGVRSVRVQLAAALVPDGCSEVEIGWDGSASASSEGDQVPFDETSSPSDAVAVTAERTIEEQNGEAVLVESEPTAEVVYSSREPDVLAIFPEGYLAATGVLGSQLVAASQAPAELAGLQFVSEQAVPFALAVMFTERYPLHPDAIIRPDDPDSDDNPGGYEAWLYDRCATFLALYGHTGDTRLLREGYRSCAYYADHIELSGENRGISTIKPEPDPKYSHVRGIYAYYALTGDEVALEAGDAIADMWLADEFVQTYRQGHLRGADKQFTERLVGHSIESLVYAFELTGERKNLEAATDLVTTAHRHITGDAATLAEINPGATEFPPQDCLIHTAEQANEGDATEPWCSGWMPALSIDGLLAYQDVTGDDRVDELFIRWTRFLRDTGSSYMRGDLFEDSFLEPSLAWDPNDDLELQRVLVPLYGAAIGVEGEREWSGDYNDYEHCLDASGLVAAGLRALRRSGGFDDGPVGPFTTEGESFVALHQEFAFCAYSTLDYLTRPHRDPAMFTSEELAEGLDDPVTFLIDQHLGFPIRSISPARKFSWWYNAAVAQFGLLAEAGVEVAELHPGQVQPS
jgi:hypothetical protein